MAQQLVKTATKTTQMGGLEGCALSPDRTLVASRGCRPSNFLYINDIVTQATMADVRTVDCGSGTVGGVAWSPDGTHLIVVTYDGSVIQCRVANNNARSTVYKLEKCAFSPRGILAVSGANRSVTLLNPSKSYSIIVKFRNLANKVYCFAFSRDGTMFAAGCWDGHMYIYGLTNGKWAQVSYNKHHSDHIFSLCFSPSGHMLLATSADGTASIWNVPSAGSTWSSTPHMTLKGHSSQVTGGAFLGDDSHVITCSIGKSIRMWRTFDGVQIATYPCLFAISLSYHAASGNITIVKMNREVEIWQLDSQFASYQSGLLDHVCLRERLVAAQVQVKGIEASIEKTDDGLRKQVSREMELKRSIADLEAKLASEKKELEELQTDESRECIRLMERRDSLHGIIQFCSQTIDSLTRSLSASGLEDLCGDPFKEWLCDIGLSKLQTELKDTEGVSLMMLNVGDVMDNGVSFSDAAALQLRGYIAHYKLSDDKAFSPPRGSVLSWDEEQTANWIKTLGTRFECLISAGWHGAALCSLSPPRVIEASEGALKAPDAVKLIGLVRQIRNETDGDKAAWVSKWSGASTNDTQGP